MEVVAQVKKQTGRRKYKIVYVQVKDELKDFLTKLLNSYSYNEKPNDPKSTLKIWRLLENRIGNHTSSIFLNTRSGFLKSTK